MKGANKITFNQATMIEAVQMYLDAQLSSTHKVIDVNATAAPGYTKNYEITLQEPDAEPA